MSDPLGLVLQAVVSHQICMLGTELGSSSRTADPLDHQAMSLAPTFLYSKEQRKKNDIATC